MKPEKSIESSNNLFGLTIGDAILITPIATALSIVSITLAILSTFAEDHGLSHGHG
jgi:hypothetical protein